MERLKRLIALMAVFLLAIGIIPVNAEGLNLSESDSFVAKTTVSALNKSDSTGTESETADSNENSAATSSVDTDNASTEQDAPSTITADITSSAQPKKATIKKVATSSKTTVASGIWGTCEWTLTENDSDLILNIGEGTGASLTKKTVYSDEVAKARYGGNKTKYVTPWDLSYEVDDDTNTFQHITKITTSGTVVLPSNCADLFQGYSKLTSISGTFDTSNVTNIARMFADDYSLEELSSDLNYQSWDLSNVDYAAIAFSGSSNIKSLDLSSWHLSGTSLNVRCMFQVMSSLESLDISGFDTSNATSTDHMFYASSKLSSLTLGENFMFTSSNSGLTAPPIDSTYTGKWTKTNPYNHDDAITTDELVALYNGKTTGKKITWVWEKYDANITFSANGGTGTMDDQSIINSSAETTLSANSFTRTGYTFSGWNTKADGSGTSYADGATISGLTDEITLYAQWTTDSYTVTLDQNGGLGGTESVTAAYGNDLPSITVPTKTGYTFDGYYGYSDNLVYDWSSYEIGLNVVSGSITNVTDASMPSGAYTEMTFTETPTEETAGAFISSSSYAYSDIDAGDTVEITVYAKYSRNITASKYGLGCEFLTPEFQGNKTLTTSWQKFTLTGTVIKSGGSAVVFYFGTNIEAGDVLYISSLTIRKLNQYYDSTGTGVLAYNKTSDHTLTAQWTPHYLKINVDINGGDVLTTDRTTPYYVYYNSDLASPFVYQISKDGLINPSYFTSGKTGYSLSNYYHIGSSDSDELIEVDEGFENGQTAAERLGCSIDDANAEITLYVNWIPNIYSVTFNSNGGTGTMSDQSMTYDTSATFTANSFTRTGYTFSGWNTKADGSGTSYSNKESVSNLTAENGETVTLYAQWTANTYTVTFDANGGSETMDDQSMTYDTTSDLTANAFTRAGYIFKGWNTEADGSGTACTDKQSVKNLTSEDGATVTLYAQWEKITSLPNTGGFGIGIIMLAGLAGMIVLDAVNKRMKA